MLTMLTISKAVYTIILTNFTKIILPHSTWFKPLANQTSFSSSLLQKLTCPTVRQTVFQYNWMDSSVELHKRLTLIPLHKQYERSTSTA